MKKYRGIPAIITIVAAIVIISCKTQFSTTNETVSIPKSTMAFERGRELVYSSCGGCHYNKMDNKFSGMRLEDAPSIIGKVYTANLTNSKTHGVPPHYTDAELKYLLKTGITNKGRYLPYMLRPNMAEEDLDAIVVYLRSDDPAVAAADTSHGHTSLNFIGHIGMNMMASPLPYKKDVKLPAESDAVAMGYYLVDNIGCFHCHSKSLTSLNYLEPNLSKGYLAGGIKYDTPEGVKIYASNLTPDKQTGIGNYSKQQFRKALKDGEAQKGRLHAPMPKFDKLKDAEIDAIYAYLQSIPAKDHKVD